MTPIQSATVSIPPLQMEETIQNKKVIAVAIAAIGFFAIQLQLSLTIALGLTAAITFLTIVCPRGDTDWLNTQFDWQTKGFWVTVLLLRPLLMQILLWALGIPLPVIPQVELTKLISTEPWKMVPLVGFLAPFTEEILFRGFLVERLEDLGLGEALSDLVQGGIFAACHLTRGIQEGMETTIFFVLSLQGYFFAQDKREEQSLLGPMAIHSASNLSICFDLLVFR